jgi:hypothetical protein
VCLAGQGEKLLSKLAGNKGSTGTGLAQQHFERQLQLQHPEVFGPHAPQNSKQQTAAA